MDKDQVFIQGGEIILFYPEHMRLPQPGVGCGGGETLERNLVSGAPGVALRLRDWFESGERMKRRERELHVDVTPRTR